MLKSLMMGLLLVCGVLFFPGCEPEIFDQFGQSDGARNGGKKKPPVNDNCGNGILDLGEQCDLGSGNQDSGLCTTACKVNACVTPPAGNASAKVRQNSVCWVRVDGTSNSRPLQQQICAEMGGRLARILDAGENQRMHALVDGGGSYFIGLTRVDGDWQWSNGDESFDAPGFLNWGPEEPRSHALFGCATFTGRPDLPDYDGRWVAAACGDKNATTFGEGFICEIPLP